MFFTQTEQINSLIKQKSSLNETEFFAREIANWKKQRIEQLQGENYYRGKHDILSRKRTVIGTDGKLESVENLPNNHIIDNQYAKIVDQKTNYLLGKPITFESENQEYDKLIKKYFGSSFQRTIKYIGEDALNGGLAWLFVYYDNNSNLCFRRFPAFEILPFWADDDHTVLDCAVRLYLQEVWDGIYKKFIERVEIFKKDGIHRYILDGFTLVPDVELGEYSPYIISEDKAYTWNKFPLIPFKYNKKEIPLIRRVKTLQDGINTIISDFQNAMEQTPQNSILVLKDYDGENLGEFRKNLATYSAVKVRGDGNVTTLSTEVNAQNYKTILELLKKALIENARGFDAKDDRLSGSPNQMNIQSMYSDIDLDANGMETEFKASLEQVLWFVNQDLITKGKGNFENEQISIIFNRDILINESESIENCLKSVGVISNQTIISQHPWTTDTQTELKRLENEKNSDDWSLT